MSRSTASRPEIRFGLLAAALAAGLLALWLSWPTADWSHDAVAYAALVHRALYTGATHVLWHQYHMLYMPLGWLVGRTLLAAGIVVDVLGLLQAINALLSATAVLVFAHLARRLTGRAGLALAVTAVLGLSHSTWYYATDPEVYPASILCLLVTLAAALRLLDRGGSLAAVATGLAAGLAFGFHAAAGLALPVVVAVTLILAPGSRRRRVALGVAVLAGFAVTGVAPYALYYRVGAGVSATAGFVDLARNVAETRTFGSGPWLLGRGFRPDLELKGILAGIVAAARSPSTTLAPAVWIARAGLVALALLVASRLPALWHRQRGVAVLLIGWLVGFVALFSAYNIGSLKFVSFPLVPSLLLVGMAAATLSRRASGLAAAAIAALALVLGGVNLIGTVIPASRPENNPLLARAELIRNRTAPGDLVVLLGVGPDAVLRIYVPYFAQREALLLDLAFAPGRRGPDAAAALVSAEIRSRLAAGHRVLALAELFDDPELVAAFERHEKLAPGTLDCILAPFRATPVVWHGPEVVLYELHEPH